MPDVLIDTDVAIDFLRGMPYAQPLLTGLWTGGQVALSVLSVYELTAGMRDVEKSATNNFIDACVIEQVTVEIATKGGELYRKYRAKGIILTSPDCLIAATALVKSYKVATRNVKHYPEKGIVFAV
ncbi:MAG: type II toxin-antitoxin system VapC family toxin [Desulfuromonadales bacterium]|nr:type II toxin-antitoxin system VapC family toxin [Desulfuromonadales bacterium]